MSHGNRGGADRKATPARLTPAEIDARAREVVEMRTIGAGTAVVEVDGWALALIANLVDEFAREHPSRLTDELASSLLVAVHQAGMRRIARSIRGHRWPMAIHQEDWHAVDRRASELAAQHGMGRN